MVLIRPREPAVLISARTAAWLERYGGMTSLRVRVRGIDPAISAELEQLREAAMSWRGSSTGTDEATRQEPATSSKWLSSTQAADLLGVTSRAVVKAIDRGALQGARVGNRWRISREDVEHYREARTARGE